MLLENKQSVRTCIIKGSVLNVFHTICEIYKLINETDDLYGITLPDHQLFKKYEKLLTCSATSDYYSDDEDLSKIVLTGAGKLVEESTNIADKVIECDAFIFHCTNQTLEIFQKYNLFAMDKAFTKDMQRIGTYTNILLYNTDTSYVHGLYKKKSEVNTLTFHGHYSKLTSQIFVDVFGSNGLCDPIHLPANFQLKEGSYEGDEYTYLKNLLKKYEKYI